MLGDFKCSSEVSGAIIERKESLLSSRPLLGAFSPHHKFSETPLAIAWRPSALVTRRMNTSASMMIPGLRCYILVLFSRNSVALIGQGRSRPLYSGCFSLMPISSVAAA
ncbi:hypothetical protein Tco_1547455 [Tanacetum coccineum]